MTTRLSTADMLRLASCLDDQDPDAIRVDAAQALLRARMTPIDRTEDLPLMQALGRVLSADVIAPIAVPAHDNSAMDGYAFDGRLLSDDASELVLDVQGIALAGHALETPVSPGCAARVMTGALIPAGTDTVIPHEYARVLAQTDGRATRVALSTVSFRQGANRRLAGEDIRQGQAILTCGRRLRASDLGLLASLGIARVHVYAKLRVAFFSTGDELRSIGQPLDAGCVYDSNRYTLHAMLTKLGVEPVDLGVVRDEPTALGDALQTAAMHADAIVSSGGVSVGDADFVRDVFSHLGDVVFWKLAMRPGRPFAFGELSASTSGQTVPFFGLPGNPVAVMASFYHLVRDALLVRMGAAPEEVGTVPRIAGKAAAPIRKRPGRTEFARGIATREATGEWQVTLSGAQGSGVLSSMSEANCFIVLQHDQDNINKGDLVDMMFFEGLL